MYSPHIYKEVESVTSLMARDLCLVNKATGRVRCIYVRLLMKTGILSKKVSLKSRKKGYF